MNLSTIPDNHYVLSEEGCLKRANKETGLSAFRAFALLDEGDIRKDWH